MMISVCVCVCVCDKRNRDTRVNPMTCKKTMDEDRECAG